MKIENIVFNCCGEFIKDLIEAVEALPIDPFNADNHPELVLEAHSREKREFWIYPHNKRDNATCEIYRINYGLELPEGVKNIVCIQFGLLSFDYGSRKYFLSATNQTPDFLLDSHLKKSTK